MSCDNTQSFDITTITIVKVSVISRMEVNTLHSQDYIILDNWTSIICNHPMNNNA